MGIFLREGSRRAEKVNSRALFTISIFVCFTQERFRAEIKKLRLIYYLKTLIFTMGSVSTRLSLYLCILVYVSVGNHLTAEKAFVIIGCYNALRSVITISIPIGISQIAEAVSSIKRIKEVLLAEEIEKKTLNYNEKPSVNIKNASVQMESTDVLKDVNLTLESGLICVTGPIASGKSTLLKLMMRDASVTGGEVKVQGRISYASQEPWLFPGTIKQNIVFGEPWNKGRYEEVTKLCALRTDLENFPLGDDTVVTDKGQNLSKGQQTRINLARAVYREAEIYLLDDSLSNLDAHVSRFIFSRCVKTFLADKLCVLVTHQRRILKEADEIIVMEKGRVGRIIGSEEVDDIKLDEDAYETRNRSEFDVNKSLGAINGSEDATEKTKFLDEEQSSNIYHEVKKEGKVDLSSYMDYFRAAGGLKVIFSVAALFLLCQVSSSWFDYFISSWWVKKKLIGELFDLF